MTSSDTLHRILRADLEERPLWKRNLTWLGGQLFPRGPAWRCGAESPRPCKLQEAFLKEHGQGLSASVGAGGTGPLWQPQLHGQTNSLADTAHGVAGARSFLRPNRHFVRDPARFVGDGIAACVDIEDHIQNPAQHMLALTAEPLHGRL